MAHKIFGPSSSQSLNLDLSVGFSIRRTIYFLSINYSSSNNS